MSYSARELDAWERDAAREEAAAMLRAPIAAMHRNEITALMLPVCASGFFDDRWSLLASAANVCTDAILEGQDFRHDGPENASDMAQVIRFAQEEA